jgi:hypothetical protein
MFELGRIYTKIVSKLGLQLPETDPGIYLERASSNLRLGAEEKRELSRLALKLVRVAKRDWLTTGRRPSSITGASLVVAMEVLNHKSEIQTISSSLGIGSRTIQSHSRELKEALLQAIRDLQIPWYSSVNLNNICSFVPQLLKYWDFISSKKGPINAQPVQSINSAPPSFVKGEIKRSLQKARIERAKIRLAQILSNSFSRHDLNSNDHTGNKVVEDSITDQDLEVERMLLAGVDEEVILNCWSKSIPESLVCGDDEIDSFIPRRNSKD